MATVATRLKLETIRTVGRHTISRFTVPSVPAASNSPIYSLDVGTHAGVLQVFRIHAGPVAGPYVAAFRIYEPTDDYEVYEILRVEEIDAKGYQECNLGIAYSNDPENFNDGEGRNEVPPPGSIKRTHNTLLFMQIENGGADTGTLIIELVIEAAD